MDTSHEVLNLRTTPIQQRSSDRMQSLLDAAAVWTATVFSDSGPS